MAWQGGQRGRERGGNAPAGARRARWLALTIAVPAALMLGACAVVAWVLLSGMASEMDRKERERSFSTMRAALDSILDELAASVTDEAAWNDAYSNVVVAPNPAWIDSVWGSTARLGVAYSEALVTDAHGAIMFGETISGPVTGAITGLYPASEAMLAQLDAAITASGNSAMVTGFVEGEAGPVALAAASIHQPLAADGGPSREQRRILWFGRPVTSALLQSLVSRFDVPLPSLVSSPAAGSATLRLADATSSPVATIAWVPERPGEAALQQVALAAVVCFAMLGATLVVGVFGMYRLLRRHLVEADAATIAEPVAPADLTAAAAVRLAEEAINAVTAPTQPAPPPSITDGLSGTDFTLAYEPAFDLRTQMLAGVTALIRWRKADGSEVFEEHVSTADLALLLDLSGVAALRQACTEMLPLTGLALTVGVSAQQFANDDFTDKVAGTLGATRFPPRRLTLLVDVSGLEAGDDLLGAAAELRRMGVSIALGNFALSPPALPFARQGLADRVVLPSALVAGLDGDPVRRQLVEVSTNVARTAGMEVTAAGIARKQDASILLRLGCRQFSGPLFAPPMSIAGLGALVQDGRAAKAS